MMAKNTYVYEFLILFDYQILKYFSETVVNKYNTVLYHSMYTHPEKKRKRNKTALDPNNQHLTYIAQTQPNQPYRHSVQVPRLSPS